ncbi:MAG: extracellular solute-binding protein [Bacilli bacterium]|nr:extracellular solute-binding protein [Bacilli bacterium]
MKKLIPVLVALLCFTVFAGVVLSTPNTVLYFLNWGEYIDTTLITKFEEQFNCQVVMEMVTSSEAMYQKITSGTTNYDVAVPGDYTVRQLYEEGYLRKFDTGNSEYVNLSAYDSLFVSTLRSLMAEYMLDSKTGEEINEYYFPYFYGAYSIIYSEKKEDVPSVIKENGFASLFDRSLYNEDVKIGMYNTARWIVASSLMAEGRDPNITKMDGTKDGDIDSELKDHLVNKLKSANFDEFGSDSMKRNVANGSLDMCYTQLGDFFDALYLVYDESPKGAEIKFNVNIPKVTSAFFDSMVIPTTCQNYDLANKFVNFMMDGDNAYQNAQAIGYSPTLKTVVGKYIEDAENGAYYYGDETTENSLTLKDFLEKYPMYLDPIGQCEKVYMLEPKSTQYLSTCEIIFNSLA